MKTLKINSGGHNFDFKCDETTRVLDLYKFTANTIAEKDGESYLFDLAQNCSLDTFCFLTDQQTKIIFKNVVLIQLLDYLEIDYNNVNVEICGIGGNFDTIDGIRFFTHSNEENHKHNPHIHTEYKNVESSYSIIDGRKLAGENYSGKIERKISRIIGNNQKELMKFWLDTTNGVYNYDLPFVVEFR